MSIFWLVTWLVTWLAVAVTFSLTLGAQVLAPALPAQAAPRWERPSVAVAAWVLALGRLRSRAQDDVAPDIPATALISGKSPSVTIAPSTQFSDLRDLRWRSKLRALRGARRGDRASVLPARATSPLADLLPVGQRSPRPPTFRLDAANMSAGGPRIPGASTRGAPSRAWSPPTSPPIRSGIGPGPGGATSLGGWQRGRPGGLHAFRNRLWLQPTIRCLSAERGRSHARPEEVHHRRIVDRLARIIPIVRVRRRAHAELT